MPIISFSFFANLAPWRETAGLYKKQNLIGIPKVRALPELGH